MADAPTTLRIPTELLERIDALEGAGQRSAFTRDAIAAELTRRESGQAMKPKTIQDIGDDIARELAERAHAGAVAAPSGAKPRRTQADMLAERARDDA